MSLAILFDKLSPYKTIVFLNIIIIAGIGGILYLMHDDTFNLNGLFNICYVVVECTKKLTDFCLDVLLFKKLNK